jgi:tetratricopeptide (TPR) repeat protein/DNA-binding winged helix-turn-helix (wHTH) protein
MAAREKQIYRFGDVEVDTSRGCVRRAGDEVHLRQKTFQVLVHLLERNDQLVPKEELIDCIWKGTAVTDDALVQCITEIRRALGDDSKQPRFIKTVPKVGYRFIEQFDAPADSRLIFATEEVTTIEIDYEEQGLPKTFTALPSKFKLKPRVVVATAVIVLGTVIASGVYVRQKTHVGKPSEAFAALAPVPGKHRVAVMYFDNQSGSADLDWLRQGFADMLITDLSAARNLNLLGRHQLNSMLERLDYKPDQTVSFDIAREVARRSNADVFVTGSFSRLGTELRINVQLYDSSTGQLTAAESLTVDDINKLFAQTDLLALKIRSHLGNTVSEREKQTSIAAVMTNNLEAYRDYSVALEKAQGLHNTEAIELLQHAIALDPQFAMAYARIGYSYGVTWGFGEKAKPFLEKAFQFSSRLTEKDRLYITAWYHIANLDFPNAIQAFEQLIAQYPLESEAYERLARLLGGEGRVDESIDVLKRGLLVDNQAKDLYNALGASYSVLGRHDDAIAMHRRYVELAPDEPNAHDSLGMSYQWSGEYEKAIAEYLSALQLNPGFEIAVFHLGNTYFQQGRYRKALEQYQHYIELAQSNLERARGADAIGQIYLSKRDLKQAATWAQKAARYDKYMLRVSVLVALERGDQKEAERLLKIYESFPYMQRGVRPTQRHYSYLEGSIAFSEGRSGDAIEKFKLARGQFAPTFEIDAYEDCLANGYLNTGQLDDAISEYQRLLQLNPNYPLAQFHLAQAYERKGQVTQARNSYREFLRIWQNADADLNEVNVAREKANLTP